MVQLLVVMCPMVKQVLKYVGPNSEANYIEAILSSNASDEEMEYQTEQKIKAQKRRLKCLF